MLNGNLHQYRDEVFRRLAEQKGSCFLADHVQIMTSIPPKDSVSSVIGFVRGESAIHLARVRGERKQNDAEQSFCEWGYFVSTAGRGETVNQHLQKNKKGEMHDAMRLSLQDEAVPDRT